MIREKIRKILAVGPNGESKVDSIFLEVEKYFRGDIEKLIIREKEFMKKHKSNPNQHKWHSAKCGQLYEVLDLLEGLKEK